MAQKIGRNEPCYCGSGKKYKKCCGATGAVPMPMPPEMLENKNKPQSFHEKFLNVSDTAFRIDLVSQFEEIISIDPEYALLSLEPDDLMRYAGFIMATQDQIDTEEHDLLTEKEVSAITRKPIYLKRAKEIEQSLMEDFNAADSFEEKAVFHMMLIDIKHWRAERNKNPIPLLWLTVSAASLQRMMFSLNKSHVITEKYVECIVSMPKEDRTDEILKQIPDNLKEALALLETNEELFVYLSEKTIAIEESLCSAIHSGELEIDLPDAWVLPGLAVIAGMESHNMKLSEKNMESAKYQTLLHSFSPQLRKDCQAAFAKKYEEVGDDHEHSLGLKLFSIAPLPTLTHIASCPLANRCLSQKISDLSTLRERYPDQNELLASILMPEEAMGDIEDALNEENDLPLAAALAVSGSMIFGESPKDRLTFARHIHSIGADQDEE